MLLGIQALMEKDSYPRFLESDLYKNLLSAYPPMPTNSNGKSIDSTNNIEAPGVSGSGGSSVCSNICDNAEVAESLQNLSLSKKYIFIHK